MASDQSASDDTLAERIRSGDESAFESLIAKHYSSLLHYVIGRVNSADDAEDILQEIFVRLWRRREEIQLHSEFRAYLFTAARNQLLNHQRSERRKQFVQHTIAQTSMFEIPEDIISSEVDQTALVQSLQIAIAALPDRAREVWELHRNHNLTYPEIAATLGLSINTVKSHMARAMAGIRAALGPFLVVLISASIA